MDQQPTGFAEGLDKLQQEAVVHVSPLPAQPPKPASSQSITGPITGERPHSRALVVVITDRRPPQSTPLLVGRHYLKILGRICLNYLLLYLQKTGTAPALTMMGKIVMQ